jgi:predicted lipoprotein with Yx(FWY)xxD motif
MNSRLFVGSAAALLLSAVTVGAGVQGVAASPSTATVKTAFNKKLKETILVDGAGRTLYMFTSDHNGKDTICTPSGPYGAECPTIWPPLTSTGAPHAGSGINGSLLRVYRRIDGKRQVTYNHHPLYYFRGDPNTPAGDKKPGDVRGESFFYEWFVLAPDGNPIRN